MFKDPYLTEDDLAFIAQDIGPQLLKYFKPEEVFAQYKPEEVLSQYKPQEVISQYKPEGQTEKLTHLKNGPHPLTPLPIMGEGGSFGETPPLPKLGEGD